MSAACGDAAVSAAALDGGCDDGRRTQLPLLQQLLAFVSDGCLGRDPEHKDLLAFAEASKESTKKKIISF